MRPASSKTPSAATSGRGRMEHPADIPPPVPRGPGGFFVNFKNFGINLGILTLGGLIFSLAFPSLLSRGGWWPLAYIALVPVFYVASRASWKTIALYGAFYGFICYAIFNYWLLTFHPLAIFIVPMIYLTYFLICFPFLRLAAALFPRHGYIVQVFIWISYEILRTKGFAGYSYGIIGYSQYLFSPLLQIAEITGVWGLSFLVVFPSAYLAAALPRSRGEGLPHIKAIKAIKAFFQRHRAGAFVYAGVFAVVCVYGFFAPRDLEESREWKVALVQHNIDPWEGGVRAYRDNLNRLVAQSEKALKEEPDIVAWSETAFVPGIDWHTRYRRDQEIYTLVDELRRFLSAQNVPFIFGNDDGQLERDRYGALRRVDYNAAILFDGGRIAGTYRKTHLVPFTEHFPYERTLAFFYKMLKEANTHFWEKGTDYVVFEAAGVKFSTPICFEDSFGYISRRFVQEGAQVILNITNDSWSGSVASEMQHLQMSVLRAVENRRSVARATNGGITAVIDPNGKILQMYEPFTEGYLMGKVPVYDSGATLYTRFGDWFAWLCLILAVGALTAGLLFKILRRKS
ncbi:MAG: apolipoprotein N-acyltransferase [Spirochaetales bacterium]|nr:apolipoprotein N-acyltransferase [Spirochaetales bacterium]